MLTTTCDYTDEQNRLVYQIVREDFDDGGKTFKQRQPDGAGGWRWNLTEITPIPYHLPDVIRTVNQNGLIMLVEGEKCADILNAAIKAAKLNAVATCNNGGAGHWGKVQSTWLKGATVLLLPDNDEPGNDHIVKAARSMVGLSSCTKRIDLPGLPPKGDIADWLAAGHTVDELRALYHAAPDYVPPPEPKRLVTPRPVLRQVDKDDRPRLRAWAQAALDGEMKELSGLLDGRYRAMKAAANRLGTIAAHSLLTESECLAALKWAMDANGYSSKKGKGEHGAEKEAQFYFKSGLSYPCDLPPARDLPELEKGIPEDFVAYIPAAKGADWSKGVPIAVRGLMNAYQGNGALLELLVEGKNRQLICDDQYITIDCIIWLSKTLKRGLTPGVIRTMVRQAENPHGVEFLRKNVHIYTDHREELIPDLVLDPCNPCAGRSPEHYSLLPIETVLANLARYVNVPLIEKAFPAENTLIAPLRIEFIAALDAANADTIFEELTDRYAALIEMQPGFAAAMDGVRKEHAQIMYRLRNPQSAPLPEAVPFKNAATYKALCAYAFLKVDPRGRKQLSRKLFSAFIGCTDGLLKGVLDRAGGLIDKLKFGVQQIRSMAQFNAIRPKYNRQYQGFPNAVLCGDKRYGFRAKDTAKAIEAALADGLAVKVLYHQANVYIIKRLTRATIGMIGLILRALVVFYYDPLDQVQVELVPEPVAEPEDKPDQEPKVKRQRKPKQIKETYPEIFIKRLAVEATLQPQDTAQQALRALLGYELIPSIEDQAFKLKECEPMPTIEILPNTNQNILLKYNIIPGEHVPIVKLYRQVWEAKYGGDYDQFWSALDEAAQIYILAYDNDLPTPESVLVEGDEAWLASIGATVMGVWGSSDIGATLVGVAVTA